MALPKLLQKLFTNGGAGDKLNKSIVPDLDYLPKSGGTVSGSVTINGTTVPVSGSTETYKEGIKFGWGSEISQSQPNGLDIWAKRGNATTVMALYGEKRDGDTTGDTPGIYIRAGDGTSTKSMRLSATKGLIADVYRLIRPAGDKVFELLGADNDGCISLIPGNTGQFSAKKSATLFITSTDYTGQAISAGSFCLSAMNATTGAKSLAGSPDGSLRWCGHNVLTVVAESYSANSWYRKYSDGWIEQGGQITAAGYQKVAITLSVPFSNTNYTILIGESTNYLGYGAQNCTVFKETVKTTGFTLEQNDNNSGGSWWMACGK